MRVRTGRFERLRLGLCRSRSVAGARLRQDWSSDGLHPLVSPISRALPASDAWPCSSSEELHSFSFGPSFAPRRSLLPPLLTSRSGSTPSPFQAQGEISPGKNAFLHCTTAGFTPPTLGHESFAVCCRSPCSASPHIRFLFIGPQLRSTLPPHARSPSRSCASLRSP